MGKYSKKLVKKNVRLWEQIMPNISIAQFELMI